LELPPVNNYGALSSNTGERPIDCHKGIADKLPDRKCMSRSAGRCAGKAGCHTSVAKQDEIIESYTSAMHEEMI